MEGKILYAMVAHWEKTGYRIVADHPVDQALTYRNVALAAIESAPPSEEKFSTEQGKYTVHIVISELRYACLTCSPECSSSAPRQASYCHIFLDRVRSVYKEIPIFADLSSKFSDLSIIDLSAPLKKLMEEHNHLESNVLPRLECELAEIRKALMEGVQKLVDRGQRLEELVRKTQTLQITVHRDFRGPLRSARKRRNILIAFITTTSIFLSTTLFVILLYFGII
ncbi:uncharacterized protein LOC105702639 [Orussus abietinus]|uniref:uncharacterized protein LOC105702639 n=1 Tax=Orussus abietinus TaxID=222816 RepID=UPI000625017B|nr:uncharacterized protein LOC105702639 [Orussus abietinus]